MITVLFLHSIAFIGVFSALIFIAVIGNWDDRDPPDF